MCPRNHICFYLFIFLHFPNIILPYFFSIWTLFRSLSLEVSQSRVQVPLSCVKCLPFLSHLNISWELAFLPGKGRGWFFVAQRFQPHPSSKRDPFTFLREREAFQSKQLMANSINCLKITTQTTSRLIQPALCS